MTELEELATAQREAMERDRAVLKEMQVQAHTCVIWELRKCTFHSGGELEVEVVYLLLLGYNFATLVGVRTKICWTMPNIHAKEMFSIQGVSFSLVSFVFLSLVSFVFLSFISFAGLGFDCSTNAPGTGTCISEFTPAPAGLG